MLTPLPTLPRTIEPTPEPTLTADPTPTPTPTPEPTPTPTPEPDLSEVVQAVALAPDQWSVVVVFMCIVVFSLLLSIGLRL